MPVVDEARLAPFRFNDLRHTCASLLIARGAHAKEIQIRLGHASITTKVNVYGHLLSSLDERLTTARDDTYRRAMEAMIGRCGSPPIGPITKTTRCCHFPFPMG